MTDDCASRYWEGWQEDPDKSERQLRNYTLTLVRSAHAAAHDSNILALKRINEMYLAGEALFKLEPYISTYEAGKFMLQLIVADSCYLNSRYEHAWELSEEVLQWLQAADQRRETLHVDARGNSEIRVIALGIQGASYFERPELCAVEVMQAKAQEFWSVAARFWDALKNPKLRKDYVGSMHHLTSIFELGICKACIRLGPDFLEKAVSLYNARHGLELEAAAEHFKNLTASDSPSSFYWDLEYSKLSAADNPDLDDLELCARSRLTGARLRFGSAPLEVLISHWRQQQLLLRH